MAGPLLELAALLSADGIPVELFDAPTVVKYLSDQAERKIDVEDARDGLGCLYRLSLVTLVGPVVRVHALVQRVTVDDLAPQRLSTAVRAAADALVHLWPQVERDGVQAQVLRANTDALAAAGGEHLWRDGGHKVLLRAARSLGESSLGADAADRFRYLGIEAARHLGPDHADTVSARANAANWQGEAGDGVGAVATLEELLPDQARVLGPEHTNTLMTRGLVATWLAEMGDLVAAVGWGEAPCATGRGCWVPTTRTR
ncbi:hypothetical protein ACQPZF_10930 [Actinosynnema sp. CS-041913]|uniref:hypothetical protein n=1 Tax=Actinosynnema sp. CS-041913 TaxID=3239917 RepID=UPI003D91C0A2